MKQFIKMVLATIVGVNILAFLAFFGFLAIIAVAAGGSVKAGSEKSILSIRLEGVVDERSSEDIYASLGWGELNLGLDDILKSIRAAKDDDLIEGILLEPGAISCGVGSLTEIREALADFRTSGKFVYAYSGAYTQGAYYMSSVADSIFLNPSGTVDWRGLAYQGLFYKRMLENVGVEMQVIKVGTYKSFTEQYTNEKMSDANREQAAALVGDLWTVLANSVSASRGIPVSLLQTAADSMLSLQPADSILALNMVDKLAYRDEVLNSIRQRMGLSKEDKIPSISTADYAEGLVANEEGDQVAVVYAVGEIDNGTTDGIQSDKLSKELLKLADDNDIKAVVLRVNSPGGSAYGSEQIWHAVDVLKQNKTVVVSMGDYAASGGYYISCGADAIVANPTTMTGSIGIFGVIPNVGPLAEKIGIDYDVVKTSEGADFPRVIASMTPIQQRRIQQYVNNGYELFTKRCSDGRQMNPDDLEKIAQGRVWSGSRALQIGLADTLGTLNDAIELAANMSNLSSYYIKEYPAKKSVWESFADKTPSLGVRIFAPKEFERERKAIEQALKLEVLQAAMPTTIKIE